MIDEVPGCRRTPRGMGSSESDGRAAVVARRSAGSEAITPGRRAETAGKRRAGSRACGCASDGGQPSEEVHEQQRERAGRNARSHERRYPVPRKPFCKARPMQPTTVPRCRPHMQFTHARTRPASAGFLLGGQVDKPDRVFNKHYSWGAIGVGHDGCREAGCWGARDGDGSITVDAMYTATVFKLECSNRYGLQH